MPNIRVSHEAARGCGYRKPGGLYMMSGKLNAPCDKLPVKMCVCPTCNQGVKPARGFTWIDPRPLFQHRICVFSTGFCSPQGVHERFTDDKCSSCLCGDAVPEKAGLIWIGSKFYRTGRDFSKEALTMGVSRRITAVPKDLKIGETVIYLAHREVEFGLKLGPHVPELYPAIFTAFIPTVIEYVVKEDDSTEKFEALEKRGIQLVDVKPQQDDLSLDDSRKSA